MPRMYLIFDFSSGFVILGPYLMPKMYFIFVSFRCQKVFIILSSQLLTKMFYYFILFNLLIFYYTTITVYKAPATSASYFREKNIC